MANVNYILYRYDEALDLSLAIENPSADDLLLIAECYNLIGDEKMAIEYYKMAAENDSTQEMALFTLAKYYADRKDISKAELYYKRLIDISENSDTWKSKLASFYIKMDKIDKAIKIYENMLQDDSLNYLAYIGMASIRESQNDTLAADSLYKSIAYNHWDSAPILNMILRAFIRLDDVEMAIEVSKRIVELHPDDYYSERRYALILFTLGRYQTADSVLTHLSSSMADDPIVYYYRGRIAQFDEDYPEAESLYVMSLAYDDTLYEVWINLAYTRNSLGGFESAMATFDSALVKCPNDSVEILYFTGVLLSREEKFTEAIDYYEKILAIQPDNSYALFNLGAAYERSGGFEEAEDVFLRLLELEPDNAMALNYLGYMYADKGIELERAEKMIKKALKIDPDNGAYLDSYAWVMFKRGKYKEALKYQLLAIKASDEDAILFDHMGDIYFKLNELEKAQSHWRKALELDPENESILEKLK